MRQHFWLPAIEDFKLEVNQDLRYLTFAGPEGFDIEFFTARQVFKRENIRVWERSADAARALQEKFGVDFQVKIGEAFTLSRAPQERQFFPHSVINLDFTSGAFHSSQPRHMPHKFEIINNIILAQREHTESFMLLAAFAAAHDVDGDHGRAFVQKTAFDIATRFGFTEPLFNLTRNPTKTYPHTLASVIPCAVIRFGGEHFYDTQCLGKALYLPYNSKRTAMLCFIFRFTYDNPPLSETALQGSTRMDEIVLRRQRESLALDVRQVNALMKRAQSGKGRRRTRSR